MIWRARKNDRFEAAPHWHVLVVRCADGSLYTDVASGADDGIKRINDGLGARYTRTRLPVFAVHSEEYMNETDAKARAAAIRNLTKAQKERILTELSVCAMERGAGQATIRQGLRSLSDIFR